MKSTAQPHGHAVLTYSPFNRAARRLLKVRSIACTLASLGHIPIEEGDDLPAGAGRIGAEGGGAGPTCDALPDRPLDGVGIVGVCGHIGEGATSADRRGLLIAVEEGHGLPTGAGRIRAEGGDRGAGGDPVGYRPKHRVIVITAGLDIREGDAAAHFEGTGGPPQEGHDLPAGAGGLRGEGGGAGARCDAVLHRLGHGVRVVGIGGDIGKGGNIGSRGLVANDILGEVPGGEDHGFRAEVVHGFAGSDIAAVVQEPDHHTGGVLSFGQLIGQRNGDHAAVKVCDGFAAALDGQVEYGGVAYRRLLAAV